MLEKPDIPDEAITALLAAQFGLNAARLAFLPLGADLNSAVYRVDATDGTPYFLKLRSGPFDEALVAVPRFLYGLGIREIIPPLPTRSGAGWAVLGAYRVILYPFIAGQNGDEMELTGRQWLAFGDALRRIHTAVAPDSLARLVPRETFSPHWRDALKDYLARAAGGGFDDPIAARVAAYLNEHQAEMRHLLTRAEQLAVVMRAAPPEMVLCHSDIHAWNVMVAAEAGEGHSGLFIVDWDAPIFAPKERDLMFFGAGMNGSWNTQRALELFYRGYAPEEGQRVVNRAALAYYRFIRIIEDIAVECEQVFSMTGGVDDRENAWHFLTGNFLPGGTFDAALHSDPG